MTTSELCNNSRYTRRRLLLALLALFPWLVARKSPASDGQPLPSAGVLPVIKVDSSSFRCEARLHVEPAIVPVGGSFRIVCEVHGGVGQVYNPFLCEEYRLPAQVVITSADGKIRRELLHRQDNSTRPAVVTTWLQLRGTVGREFNLTVGGADSETLHRSGARTVDLPPGDYYGQAVYNNWLLARRPSGAKTIPPASQFVDNLEPQPQSRANPDAMNNPIAISEPVKFTVATMEGAIESKNSPSKCPLRIDLRLDNNRPTFGRDITAMIRLVNISEKPLEVYNPFLDSLLQDLNRALVLSLATPDGVQIGHFLRESGSFSGGPTADHWITIPPGGTTLTASTFAGGRFSPSNFSGPDMLPPGTYHLQVCGYDHLTSGRPSGIEAALLAMMPTRAKEKLGGRLANTPTQDPKDEATRTTYSAWLNSFPGSEICRSNRVELEILPRTGD